ncbi:MAG: thioredoxin domain-containing protein [Syntrophobacter sp.]
MEVFDRSFGNEVLAFPGPVFTLFWAPWCGHCARLMPIIDELASEFSGKIKFAKMDLDKNPLIASQYQVKSVPAMLLFKNGRMVNQLLGALPKYQIEHHLRGLIQ